MRNEKSQLSGRSNPRPSPRQQLQDAYNQALLDHLSELEKRLVALEQNAPKDVNEPATAADLVRGSRLPDSREIRQLALRLEHTQARAESMRIDRQMVRAVRLAGRLIDQRVGFVRAKWIERSRMRQRARDAKRVARDMTLRCDVLVICPAYPGGARKYGGEFIERRVLQYRERGVRVAVLECSPRTRNLSRDVVNGIDVLRVNPAGAAKALTLSQFKHIAGHMVEPFIWQQIKSFAKSADMTVFIHGYEARDWRELSFNFEKAQIEANLDRLEKANAERRATVKEIFDASSIQKVFVSNHMRDTAHKFVGREAEGSHVIHNCISARDFPYVPKTAEHRYKILWVRSFAAKNYSNDLSSQFVEALMERPYADKIEVSIFGDGPDFGKYTRPLSQFPNVSIQRRFLNLEEIRDQHAKHGIILVPSRWDSQGLTCGEAMSSGLVPFTNRVAALPEFVDTACGVLAKPDSFQEFVDAMDLFDANPDIYLQMSENAAKRAQWQCGEHATIESEIGLLDPKSERFPNAPAVPEYMSKSPPAGLPDSVDAIRP